MCKKTIVITDDDHGYRFPIKNLFEDHGYSVLEAETVDQFRSHSEHADVWIVDVRLPTAKMEGIEAVRELWPHSKKPLVVFISVMPEATAKQQLQALKHQSVDYKWLEKPFELELLLKIVNASIGGA